MTVAVLACARKREICGSAALSNTTMKIYDIMLMFSMRGLVPLN